MNTVLPVLCVVLLVAGVTTAVSQYMNRSFPLLFFFGLFVCVYFVSVVFLCNGIPSNNKMPNGR